MHVALSADRTRIPESRRHHVDGLNDSLARDALVASGSELGERTSREDRARPGAKVLRR